ncbi:cytochrome c [Hymenobacter radiodurans]|uniref:cytochrome c n=1 Tax=Hymenobacter radiodurans TaxID=2496028 RepID=UPI00105872CA|nr:cytochrome c [Hymenobacter radiodurans]
MYLPFLSRAAQRRTRATYLGLLILLNFISHSGALGQNAVTYTEHIAPIIQLNCTPCHKPGGAAPFSLLTFQDVARRARTIQSVTQSRYMPPWKADPHYVSFANERRLTEQQIALIRRWTESGAKRGPEVARATPAPSPEKAPQRKPDLILRPKKAFAIRGDGAENFVMFKIPFEIPANQNVQAVEFVPGNRALVHHANYAVQSVGPEIDINAGQDYVLSDQFLTNLQEFQPLMQHVAYYGGWIPGASKQEFPAGIGFTMPKRGVILLTAHYGPSGVDTTDWSQIKLYFTKAPIKREIQATSIGSGGLGTIEPPLVIPADSVKKFRVQLQTSTDLSLLYVWPHMHLVGKKFKAWATTPEGKQIPLVSIPEWDFRWQESYQFKRLTLVPKGSVIQVEGTYDNTTNNPNNPFSPPEPLFHRI